MTALPSWRRYAPWILGPILVLVATVVVLGRSDRGATPVPPLSNQLFVSDAKLRRTLGAFDAGALDAELPVASGEGLTVRLELDPVALRLRLDKRNRERLKTRRTDASIQVGDGPPMPATVHLRGQTTLRMGDQLNFDVELLRPQPFEGGVSLDRFYLIAMVHDPHQIVSQTGYRIFRDLGLYPPLFRYVRMVLNGQPQGAYLLLEPPRQGLRRVYPELVAIYRRKAKGFYKVEWEKEVPRVDASIKAFRGLRGRDPLEDPIEAYAPVLELDAYLRYLAANTLLLNQDMQAEVFFYERRSDPARPAPLALMAWDLEDIGSTEAKPGVVDDPLIFSGSDLLDFQIHREPALRRRYVATLREVLTRQLTPEYIAKTLREVRALRDSFDDGRPPAEQEADRRAREAFAISLEARLRERHAELMELLEHETASPRS